MSRRGRDTLESNGTWIDRRGTVHSLFPRSLFANRFAGFDNHSSGWTRPMLKLVSYRCRSSPQETVEEEEFWRERWRYSGKNVIFFRANTFRFVSPFEISPYYVTIE